MATNQITLAFSVSTVSTPLTPAQAAARLAAAPLYTSRAADPVLGQLLGLTVAGDAVSTGGVTYTGEAGGPFLPGETVTDSPSGGTAAVAVDEQDGTLYFVEGTISGTFAHGDTVTGGTSGATATVNNAAALGGPTPTTPGATRALVLNTTSETGAPPAPPPFPCRPTGPQAPPPAAPAALPYTLSETTTNPYTRLPVTSPAPTSVVAVYSTSTLDTDGVDTTPAIPAGPGAQIVELTYHDSTGAGPFTVFAKLMGKFPAPVTLAGGSVDVAVVNAFLVYQTGNFQNSVGQVTLCALEAPLPAVPTEATPEDFVGITDAAQLTIVRPLVYLPPSYYAIAQQGASEPTLAGDFLVKQGSPTVLTTISQVGVLAATDTVAFASQPGATYTIASVSATLVELTAPYTGLSPAETAPAAEAPYPAQSVSGQADRSATSTCAVAPTQAAPPTTAALTSPLSEFTLPQTAAPAITYSGESGKFTPGETAVGQKSGGAGTVIYDAQNIDATGTLVFSAVTSGFVRGETVKGLTSSATATVVNPSTLAPAELPTPLSGLYARALQLAVGAPVVAQPITLV